MVLFCRAGIPIMAYLIIVLVLVLLSYALLIPRIQHPLKLSVVPVHHRKSRSPPAASNKCDYSSGTWVWDETHNAGSYTDECQFLDPGFRCVKNGRKDTGYQHWRWQPHGCNLTRFNASDMLERSRNKRIVFVGDSLGRNQWESLLCMLSTAVKNKSSIYEANGKPLSKHRGYLIMLVKDFNLTVEYFRSPHLVVHGRPPQNSPPEVRGVIRVDTPEWESKHWAGADVLIFNTGHWWIADKTSKQGRYFQLGQCLNMTMDVQAAFRKSINTTIDWAFSHMKRDETFLFFRGYSPQHFSEGNWDTGGLCDSWTEPETDMVKPGPEPWYNRVISESVEELHGKGFRAHFLNITHLSEFRRDGHASKHREPGTPVDAPQDCSHWCLPGVPDTWNELVYANLLSEGYGAQKCS